MQKFILENLDCASCANKIEKALNKMSCVNHASINFNTNTLYIQTDKIDLVQAKIKELEPNIIMQSTLAKSKNDTSSKKEFFVLSSLLCIFLVCISLLYYTPAKSFLLTHITFLNTLQDWLLQDSQNVFFKTLFTQVPVIDIFIYCMLGIIYIIAGLPIFLALARNIQNKTFFDENSLMFIATIAAFCIGEISEAVAVMLFFRTGEFLESLAVKRSKKSLYDLLDIMPEIAHIKKIKKDSNETIWQDIHPELLQKDDVILVKVGEKIPTDGIVIWGKSHLNTQSLNGESKPFSIAPDSEVLAGSINLTQAIEIKVKQKFEHSQIAKMKHMVEEASNTKAKTQKLITKFAKIYTPIMFFFALGIACIPPLFDGEWHEWIYRALVVLMVSCPCALVLSVPLGYFGALGIASRKGILIKGSEHFETLAKLKNIVFDKTGTLTKGTFQITKIQKLHEDETDLLELAMRAQRFSNHPIARSIMQASNTFAKDSKTSYTHTCQTQEYKEISGKGVVVHCCNDIILAGNQSLMQEYNIDLSPFNDIHKSHTLLETNSIVHIAKNGIYKGYILLGDSLKEDTKETINKLKSLNITPYAILSGDNEKNVSFVAKELGINKFYANLLPTQKADMLKNILRDTKKEGVNNKTAFVGDGINDCIVLSMADVGISVNAKDSNNDLSKENSDVILTNPSLSGLIDVLKIAKKIQTITWQNIFFALGTKLLLVLLGIAGIANMWLAVFGDVGVALLALFNALRVARIK